MPPEKMAVVFSNELGGNDVKNNVWWEKLVHVTSEISPGNRRRRDVIFLIR